MSYFSAYYFNHLRLTLTATRRCLPGMGYQARVLYVALNALTKLSLTDGSMLPAVNRY
jgi:hypothetical protein